MKVGVVTITANGTASNGPFEVPGGRVMPEQFLDFGSELLIFAAQRVQVSHPFAGGFQVHDGFKEPDHFILVGRHLDAFPCPDAS